MSLLASPIHSFVHLYIHFMFILLVFFSLHLSIFIYFYVYTCLFLYTFVHLDILLCLHFLSFSLYICPSFYSFMYTLVVLYSVHIYIRLMLTLVVFLSPSICCPFEKMKSRSVDERSCPFLSKIKITQNMFLEQKNVLAKFRRMSLRWTRHTDD